MIAHVLTMKYVLGGSLLPLRAAVCTRGLLARPWDDVPVRRACRSDPRLHRRSCAQRGHRHRVLLGDGRDRRRDSADTPSAMESASPAARDTSSSRLPTRTTSFSTFSPSTRASPFGQMFKGFSGYVQADAHAIYDALFKGIPPEGAEEKPGECGPAPIEVACWCHARRKYWEAAVCKHPLGLEGVRRIDAIFDADRPLTKLPPVQRKARREQTVRPLVDAFFTWAHSQYGGLTERGLIATALGYSIRHEQALRRFLDDGRLRMENNAAERELRTIAVGRKAWMFYGSDDHAGAAGNILSLVASCKLHGLDPEPYLAEIIHVLPYWPRDRYIELAPKYWARHSCALVAQRARA